MIVKIVLQTSRGSSSKLLLVFFRNSEYDRPEIIMNNEEPESR